MLNSKAMIEDRLPGKRVAHLCYPWFEGEDFAVRASKAAGYAANYYGSLRGKPSNRPGDDSYRITRIGGEYLHRLPGAGRKTLWEILRRRLRYRRGAQEKNYPIK